jgi:hypothetical protein
MENEIIKILNTNEHNLFILIENNLLYFTIIFAAIIGKIKESSKQNILSVWLIYLIGTFAHELMHLVVSIITFGKPTWFSILPSKTINNNGQVLGYTLGYVKSKNIRWYNVALISLAPLLLIPLSYLIYTDFFNYIDRNLYSYILYIFIIISLLFSSIPSSVDFRNIFNGFKTILNFVPLGMVCILLYINHYGF